MSGSRRIGTGNGERGTGNGRGARAGILAVSGLAAIAAIAVLGAVTAIPTTDPTEEWVAEEDWPNGDGTDHGAEVAFWTDTSVYPNVKYAYVVGTIEVANLDPPAKVLAVYKYEVEPDEFEPGEYAAVAYFPPDPNEAEGTTEGVGIIVDEFNDAIYVTGYTTYEPDGDPGDDYNYVTIKFDRNLSPSAHEDPWEDDGSGYDGVRIYDGPVSGTDKAVDVGLDLFEGDVFVTGTSAGNGTGRDIASLRYVGTTGDLSGVWADNGYGDGVRRYDNADYESASDDSAVELGTGYVAVEEDEPSGPQLYVVGTSYHDDTGWDIVTIKYDTNGHDIYEPGNNKFGWVHRFDAGYASSDVGTGIDVTIDGNTTGVVSICGYSVIPPPSLGLGGGGTVLTVIDDTDYTVYTLDPVDGHYFWSSPGWRHYNGPGGQYGNNDYSVDIDTYGTIQNHHFVCVTGRVRSGSTYAVGTVVYDNGTVDWSDDYAALGGNTNPTSIVVDDGPVYVGGSAAEGSYPLDYMLLKYSGGNLDWDVYYDHATLDQTDLAFGMGFVPGFVVLTGQARNSNPDFVTINWNLP